MCNIAGYVGTKRAAPILIEMMLREEGYNGGFYTGLATIHNGELYHAKQTGNTKHLIENTNAQELPGTVGIMHSRTNDGGGDAWAHPFIGYRGEHAALAYVANGAAGFFTPRLPEYSRKIEILLEQGYRMAKLPHTENKPYQVLSDGTHVHMSDAMCQLILRNMDRGSDTVSAMAEAFCEMPAEVVALTVTPECPNRIQWARINTPMYVGFAEHGAYLASTPLAFPDDVRTEPQLLPACAAGTVCWSSFSAEPFREAPARVAPLDAEIRKTAYDFACRILGEESIRFADLVKLVKPLFKEGDITQAHALVYEILLSLKKQERLIVISNQKPAARKDLNAYQYHFSL